MFACVCLIVVAGVRFFGCVLACLFVVIGGTGECVHVRWLACLFA